MKLSLDTLRIADEKGLRAIAFIFSGGVWFLVALALLSPFYLKPIPKSPCYLSSEDTFYTEVFSGYFPISPTENEEYFSSTRFRCIDPDSLDPSVAAEITEYYESYSEEGFMCILGESELSNAQSFVSYEYIPPEESLGTTCLNQSEVPDGIWQQGVASMRGHEMQPGLMIAGFVGLLLFYGLLIVFLLFIIVALAMAHIRLNALRLSPTQHPELFKAYKQAADALQVTVLPPAYVIDMGGDANAFAVKIAQRHMIVFFAETIERLVANGEVAELQAIAAHELGHVKLKHTSYQFFLLPFRMIPYLNVWLSRMQEYSADRAALYVAKDATIVKRALAKLVLGTYAATNLHTEEYIANSSKEWGLFTLIAKLLSTHPPLPERMKALENQEV